LKEPSKTNAARLLDQLGIPYELRPYEVDLQDLTAVNVARKIGMPAEQVFKTLLTESSAEAHFFAVVPGDQEVDLKKLARAAGVKKLDLASLKRVEPLTGFGKFNNFNPAIGRGILVRDFSAFADETIELFDLISVSAGQRGLQLILAPADYLRATAASVASLTKAVV